MNLDLTRPDYAEAIQYYLNGDWKKAAPAFAALHGKEPDNPFILLLMGNINYSLGNLDKAVEEYRKAIDVKSDFGIAYYKLGVCYYRAGKLGRALEAFDTILQLKDQSHAMASYFVGLINHLMGNDEEAERGFDILCRQSPESLIANYYLAQIKIKHNKYDEALKLLEALVETAPSLAEVHYLLGIAKFRLHDNVEAIKCFRKALDLNPEDTRARSYYELLLNP